MTFEHTVTDLPTENEYPKLVRDKIPEIIAQANGREVPVRTLELDEFIGFLKKKAVEEAEELEATDTDSHLLEEIADLREILDTLEASKGFTPEQVKAVQDEKREKRGGFALRLLMLNND
jgi:predicted house-cleaning noncanonical NTP pyrophosphatase (MazG superfamily)